MSTLWTFLFGFIYFMYKGWFKAAIVHIVLVVLTAGLWWLLVLFFAQKFVDAIET